MKTGGFPMSEMLNQVVHTLYLVKIMTDNGDTVEKSWHFKDKVTYI